MRVSMCDGDTINIVGVVSCKQIESISGEVMVLVAPNLSHYTEFNAFSIIIEGCIVHYCMRIIVMVC